MRSAQKTSRVGTTSSESLSDPRGKSSGQISLVNAFWAGNRVCIVQRIEGEVSKRFAPAEYTCFIKVADLDEANERRLRELRHVIGMKKEGSWWRVKWRDYNILKKACGSDGPFAKAGLKVYEADVNPVRRFLTDSDVKIQRPLRCYIDLEVDSRETFATMTQGKARILSWALSDDTGRKVYGILEREDDESEVLLIGDLWDELLAYDQVCAWNGDRFDFPVLHNRSSTLEISIEPRRWLWLDHLGVYKRFNMNVSESGDEKESMALDRVAEAVLKRGKYEGFDARKVYESWRDDPQLLIDYNIEDTVLMRDIEAETGYLELHYTVCEACSTLPDSRGTNPTNFVEGYMLKLGMEFDQHFPTKFDLVPDHKFEGAYVMEPTKKGILTEVHVCDFASLYPSTIISWNMSPETLTDFVTKEDVTQRPSYLRHVPAKTYELPEGHCVVPITDKVFRIDKKGILPIALERLNALRKVWTERKDQETPGTPKWKEYDRRAGAYKIAANSFYGVQGSIFSRFHVRDVAESIAQAGKWLILQTHEEASKRGFESIYADTDSLFVTGVSRKRFSEFVNWCNVELYPRLLKEKGCVTNAVKLAYEKEFSRLILIRKKRYAGKYAHFKGKEATADSKPEIKGLEYKRGDTLKLARDFQYRVVEMLLFEEIEDVDAYRDEIRKWRDWILEGELKLEDVRMSKQLSREVHHYSTKTKKDGSMAALPVHVEVAKVLQEQGFEVGEGVRIEYVVVDGRSPLQAIPAADFDGEVDRYYLWEALVYKPTLRLLEVSFPDHKWKDYLKVRPFKSGKPRVDSLGQTSLF